MTVRYRAHLQRCGLDALEHYEERAAIREHCGGQPRDQAERAAYLEVCRRLGLRLGLRPEGEPEQRRLL